MSFWLRYILRSLARGRRRVFFALICISVGVGSVVALQTATLTVQNALTSNVRAANGGDVSVSSDATPLSSRDLAVFRRLQRQGRITQWTAIYGLHATSVGDNHRLVPFDMQVVSPSYPIGGQPTFVSPANATVAGLLQHPGDVLVTSVLADEMGIGLGSRVFVHTIGGRGLHATVRGILAETSFEHAAVMTVHQRDAARLSTAPPHYASVYVNTPDSVGIGASLRNRFPVANVQTVQEALNAARQQVHDFQQFMLLVGLMALLVAGIGILNAMQSMLAFRRLEIAMLKAIGFRHWTLYGLFGGEALLTGLLGGVSGTIHSPKRWPFRSTSSLTPARCWGALRSGWELPWCSPSCPSCGRPRFARSSFSGRARKWRHAACRKRPDCWCSCFCCLPRWQPQSWAT
jgi:putative ABC transport system permease protein